MAKRGSAGDPPGMPSLGKAKQKAVKAFFDQNIIQQYVDDFQRQFGLPRDRLWTHAAQVLGAPKTTGWRWATQVGRHGMQKQADPQPRINEMLRYIAATGQTINMPCGQDIVLRSLAATLIYIRAQLPRYAGEVIDAREVELMRFALEHPVYIDPERGITEKMIGKMRSDIGHTLRITDSYTEDKAVAEVKRIIKFWRASWDILIQEESLTYHWIYYN
jgi:hypothetical protein